MSHVSLYRKYRSKTFDEIRGQDAVVKTLKSALKSGNISHAYLFAGSRGTGKTSIARIFARELGTSPNDIYEIDAASNNGVDEIRELRDGVSTLPFDSKYKVYILDEVHMLSKAAFNALLKTLEEPPAHVIFILATTELHKVLDTVKSRCQVFEFKKASLNDLETMIMDWSKVKGKEEGDYEITPEAVELIAKFGDGAYRDTWGFLERVMQSAKKNVIDLDLVVNVIGSPHQEIVNSFIDALIAKDLDKALEHVHEFSKKGDSIELFLIDVATLIRFILLTRFAPEFAKIAMEEHHDDFKKRVSNWAKEKNIVNSQLLLEFLNLIGEVKKTSLPEIPVELALIRILGNTTNT